MNTSLPQVPPPYLVLPFFRGFDDAVHWYEEVERYQIEEWLRAGEMERRDTLSAFCEALPNYRSSSLR